MKKRIVKLLTGVLVTALSFSLLVGCNANENIDTNESLPEVEEKVEEGNGKVDETLEEQELKITLKGDAQIKITEGEPFEDPGVTVNKEAKVITKTFLDENVPGIYEICYTAETKDEVSSVIRVVEVVKK